MTVAAQLIQKSTETFHLLIYRAMHLKTETFETPKQTPKQTTSTINALWKHVISEVERVSSGYSGFGSPKTCRLG